ncbi:MAG: queuosine precursor transporter [Defluviitoga tunisiensis]
MKKTNNNLIILNAVFVMSLLVANIVGGKVVSIIGLTVPAAVVSYAITFLCTDIINEIWGKEEANRTVKLGLVIQLFSLALILLAIALPPAEFAQDYNFMFKIVLGQNVRMVIASLIAYLLSQTNDVFLFNYLKRLTKGKHKWIRNNVSTMTSQIIDTAIFITIAFYGQVPNLPWMIISQYIIKWILALLDTPFFYYFTRETKQNKIK